MAWEMGMALWVVASRNRKKAAELTELLVPFGVEARTLADFPGAPEVEETGASFAENARLKAESAARATGLPALADDSGLCVDALDGAPGVYSARYAGEGADDRANNAKLLRALADTPPEKRGAAFRCAAALARPGSPTALFEGETRGVILSAPRGEGGFGYDPLFLSDDLGVTFAEAPSADKHSVSHRGRALAALRAWLFEAPGRASL
jgi:XTP/dITP diphosphohydrolase